MERRTVNPELARFLGEVNIAVKAAAGVSYTEVLRDLHDDTSAMKETFEAGGSATAFAELVVQNEALALVSEHGNDAREINLRRAALSAYAEENPKWLNGGDGAIYTADEPGTIFRILPVKSKKGDGWGFAAEQIEGNLSLDVAGRVAVPADAKIERLGAGIDVSDAIQAYDQRYDRSAGYGLH